MINPMDLTGKHILVTGGSSGIGRQTAIQASRLGAKVTLIARNQEKLQKTIRDMEHPDLHAYYPFDLNDVDKIEDLIKTIVAECGQIDGLCHAAGIGNGRILKSSKPAFVQKMFQIHTFAFFELIRCLSLKGHLHDGASLVGISSVAAEKGNLSQGAYASAKAAMNGLLRSTAVELAPRKIRVNNVAFAMVDTEMYQDFLDYGGDPKVMQTQFLGVIDAESAANVIAFLLSDSAKFITAAVLPVYAGY